MHEQIDQKLKEIDIHKAMKLQRIAEARGIQKSMNDLNSKLTPEYLQWEAIKAQKALAGSPNHTTTYVPRGFPVTGTVPTEPAAGASK